MTRFGFLSTYPPTRCGLATFTDALASAIVIDPGSEARIVRVLDAESPAPPAVTGTGTGTGTIIAADLVAGDERSAALAVQALNACDVAIVQHEYGIYGGTDGDEVIAVLDGLRVPAVVVFHTVLTAPTPGQKAVLERVGELAAAVVVMTDTAYGSLLDHYAIPPSKIRVIAHGVAEWAHTASETDRETRRVLTWGLIGPGKGIEWGIRAIAQLADMVPAPEYAVVGQTHPKVLAREGDRYRDMLSGLIDELGLADAVTLDARYLDAAQLAAVVGAADVVLLPYDSRDQMTSGVLVEAIAAGIPVVATGFPHAIELLDRGPGILVAHEDSSSIASALRTIFSQADVAQRLREAAAIAVPETSWSDVAVQYRSLATTLVAAQAA